jgi:RecB family endonuclease NucS
MTLFTINQNKLEPVSETSYANEAILERKHLQSLLKQNIAPLGDDLMVLCDEFSNWQDSSRRIDILCITNEAQLAVIELKRTEDGGHMELQAIR